MNNLKYPKGSYIWEKYHLNLGYLESQYTSRIVSSGPKWVTLVNYTGWLKRKNSYPDTHYHYLAYGDPVYGE